MSERDLEIVFLRQAIQARRISAALPERRDAQASYRGLPTLALASNGQRGTLREIGIASCPLAPDSRITTRGKLSQEGIVAKQIAENDAEIARLKAELGLS